VVKNDSELIKDIKDSNSADSFEELAGRHANLYYKICQKYYSAFKASGITPEDVFAEKDYTIYRSAMTFDPSKKTKFSTWLGNYTKYSCLNMLKKNSKYISCEITWEDSGETATSLLDKYVSENSSYEDPTQEIRERVFHILEKVKDKRIYEIFKLRYAPEERKKMTWKNIAKRLGISAQTAINLHSKGTDIVSQKINSDYPDIL